MLTEEVKEKIKEHSLKENPNECCGFVLFDGNNYIVYECKNKSENKKLYVSISPYDYLRASKIGEMVASYHSQIEEEEFSEIDRINSENHNIPYIMYCLKNNEFKIHIPLKYKNQYVGREFRFGINDCYSLIRDYYKKELNIFLSNYERDGNWYKNNPEMFIKHFEKEGFSKICDGPIKKIDNLKKYDCILINYEKEKYPSHLMMYYGKGFVLHHPINRYSLIEPFSEFYKEKVFLVCRHKKDL